VQPIKIWTIFHETLLWRHWKAFSHHLAAVSDRVFIRLHWRGSNLAGPKCPHKHVRYTHTLSRWQEKQVIRVFYFVQTWNGEVFVDFVAPCLFGCCQRVAQSIKKDSEGSTHHRGHTLHRRTGESHDKINPAITVGLKWSVWLLLLWELLTY
jgi:hypothetical protein